MDSNTEEDYRASDRLRYSILESFNNKVEASQLIAHLRGRSIISDESACHFYEKVLGCNGGNNVTKIVHSERGSFDAFLRYGTSGLITWMSKTEIEGVKKEMERLRAL